jgi:site-specific recombinase XerD
MGEAVRKILASEVPCIRRTLSIWKAKDLFMATLESKHTHRAYDRHIGDFINLLDFKVVGNITAGHLLAYRNYIVTDGRGAASHKQAINAVKTFVLWLASMNGSSLRAEHVRNLLKAPNVVVIQPYQVLTKAEIRRLLKVAKESGLRNYAMMLVFLGAGLRVSEVVGISCRDLRQDGDAGAYIHVRGGKGRKDRLVPVHDKIMAAVQAYLVAGKRRLGTDEPLFLGEDTMAEARGPVALNTRTCNKRLFELCEKAGIAKKISPHSLRHTYALAALRHGKNIMAVSKLLGHTTIVTTQRYVDHLDLMDMRQVVPGFLVGGR